MSFFLLNFLSSSLLAQTGRLGGTIVSSATASPLPESHVFIPNTTFQAFSDENGNFQLTNLPEGTWELQVRGLGWEKFSQEIQVKAGISIQLSIRLNKQGNSSFTASDLSKSKINKLTKELKEVFVGDGLAGEQIQF
uniref:carboxypeptidase-like regulatory domain-containing protein n=1 Tax=Algoriphagus sp. TaxID=1872435 RepID=UPI004047ECBE